MNELKNASKKSITKHKDHLNREKKDLITESDLVEIESSIQNKSKMPFIKGSRFTHAQNLQFTQV
jgi:hypothetical protein